MNETRRRKSKKKGAQKPISATTITTITMVKNIIDWILRLILECFFSFRSLCF